MPSTNGLKLCIEFICRRLIKAVFKECYSASRAKDSTIAGVIVLFISFFKAGIKPNFH